MMRVLMCVLVSLMAGTSSLPLEDSRGVALLWQQLNDGHRERPSPDAQANRLTPAEIADGWIQLFDGESTSGWKTEGTVETDNYALVVGGVKDSTIRTVEQFGRDFEVRFEYRYKSEVGNVVMACITDRQGRGGKSSIESAPQWTPGLMQVRYDPTTKRYCEEIATWPHAWDSSGLWSGSDGPSPVRLNLGIGFEVPAGTTLELRRLRLKPLGMHSLTSGFTIFDWKGCEDPFLISKLSLTKEGWLKITNGPGELQTRGQWDDFILQLDAISKARNENGGVSFRCRPGKFQSGYRVQIANQWQDDRRWQPLDYGTGGLYRLEPARRVVSNDNEWFKLTIHAQGNHFAVWVNGFQTVDFTDNRAPAKSAHDGSKLEKGPIGLVALGAAADLSFRNIRIVDLPRHKPTGP
jgi:hypothetical protein